MSRGSATVKSTYCSHVILATSTVTCARAGRIAKAMSGSVNETRLNLFICVSCYPGWTRRKPSALSGKLLPDDFADPLRRGRWWKKSQISPVLLHQIDECGVIDHIV